MIGSVTVKEITLSIIKEAKTRYSQARVKEILSDYRLAVESREASLIGRKEVFMGKDCSWELFLNSLEA